MPIPKPKKGEKEKAFISRCMGNPTMVKDYPKEKQRAAVCYGQVGNIKMDRIVNVNAKLQIENDVQVQTVRYNGSNHLVAPVVMLVEGVHHGNGGGPLFYPAEAIEDSTEGWNGRPVTINHPVDSDGKQTLCNQPAIYEKEMAGWVFNSKWDGENRKLRAELYVNIASAQKKAPALTGAIMNHEAVEVSTGLLAKIKNEAGEWNGEEYEAVVLSITQDHLAILPESEGACNFEDGCGIRANQKGGKMDWIKETFKRLISISNKDESVFDKVRAVAAALDSEVKNTGFYHYVEDVFDEYVIYERGGGGSDPQLFKRAYNINEDGVVTLGEKPVPVKIEKTYKEIESNSTKKEAKGNMSDKTEKKCCVERVKALIANEKTPYTEEDREWLEAMTEDQFAKIELTAHEQPETEDPPPATPKAPAEGGATPVDNEKKIELKDLPDDMRKTVIWAQNKEKAEKDALIIQITANERCKYTKEMLEAKDLSELTILADMVPGPEPPKVPDTVRVLQGRVISGGGDKKVRALPVPTLDDMKTPASNG